MKNFLKLILTTFLVYTSLAEAQTASTRHPRVMELEKSLTKESLDFLKGRFPKHPFLVTVAVDPIFRTTQDSKKESEALPFFDPDSSEEILDEWDDPAQTSSSLMKRAKKILVTVSIPASLTEDEISEIQQSLMNNLGLFPARDGVEIRKRNWTVEEEKNNSWTYIGWGAAIWILIMVGLMAIAWPSVSRLVKALKDSSKDGKNSAAVIPQAPPASSGSGIGSGSNKPTQISGDLKFSDPIKYREMISHIVTILKNNKHFPILEDMILLDKYGQTNPSGLGAVLAEFPIEIKKKLFSYSAGNHWLEALAQPGELDSRCLDVYLKLIRVHRTDSKMDVELLLINTWRLGAKRVEYIKSITSSQAMSLLAQMPKDIGVKTAKEAFPGNWGALLDPHFKPVEFDANSLAELMSKAEKLCPYREYSSLELFKREKDLIEYVRIADVSTEREIYTATPSDSFLHLMRPPFFKVLEMPKEVLDYLVPRYSIDDWSQVCFNVPKAERREIEKRLNEKQKFRFFELMKQMDANPADPLDVGIKRENIAKEASEYQTQLKNKQSASANDSAVDEQPDENNDSTETAA